MSVVPEPRTARAIRAAGPASFRISEIFLSLQGEGPSAGTPAHFVRLQGCTIGCRWCDTKYSWDAASGSGVTLEEIWSRARALGEAPLLVVTGGEPLEHAGLPGLLDAAVDHWSRVEVETSGIAPPPRSHPRLHWNVSPKLPSATPRWRETWTNAAAFVAEPRATFKIVVGGGGDAEDALRLIREHGIPKSRVMLMPEGMTAEALRAHAAALAPLCAREGLRLGPRLHIWIWGARRGV